MIGTRISSGSSFEALAGYSRAVVLADPGGDWVLVSGTTGFDYRTMQISPEVEKQTRQCFANIEAALAKAGASLADVVRVRIFLADRADFAKVAPIVGQHMSEAKPANTTVVAPLIDERMKIEIEVTARRGI
ncbi:MAG: RidA family protein [Pseudomonadota bacterium]|nr:RidA family protein [Pseudomonadota bacterium]